MKKILILFLISQAWTFSFAQGDSIYVLADSLQVVDYDDPNTYALSLTHHYLSVEKLSKDLTKPFTNDSAKVRAIFRWMTENIAYDCKKYHARRVGKSHKSDNKIQLLKWEKKQDRKNASKTLRKGKGVCSDYADLFSELCNDAGIECQTILGYAVNNPKKLKMINHMNSKASNHAWNVVTVNGQWYLMDVTWASGYCDKGVKVFTKALNEDYYLTPPGKLISDHHPKADIWQLLEVTVSMDEFIKKAKEDLIKK